MAYLCGFLRVVVKEKERKLRKQQTKINTIFTDCQLDSQRRL